MATITTAAPPLETQTVQDDLLRPLRGMSVQYLAVVALCALVIGWAGYAWAHQIFTGIGVAGIRRPVFWGLYIIDFTKKLTNEALWSLAFEREFVVQ